MTPFGASDSSLWPAKHRARKVKAVSDPAPASSGGPPAKVGRMTVEYRGSAHRKTTKESDRAVEGRSVLAIGPT